MALDPKPRVVTRLTDEVYAHFVKNLYSTQIAVDNDTSPMRAGFMLGVQYVLQELRKGVVVG